MATIVVAGLGYYGLASAGAAGSSAAVLGLIAAGTAAFSVGAAYLDGRYIYPALFGVDQPRNPTQIAGIESMTGEDGAPSFNAWGRAALIGGHALFVENLDETTNRSTTKKGGGATMTRRRADVCVAWCHTEIESITRVFADQKQFWELDPNQVLWGDYRVTVTAASGRLVLTHQVDDIPDFDPMFAPGAVVFVEGLLLATGAPASFNGWYRVHSVAGAAIGATLGSMELSPLASQTPAAGVAGTETAPMIIRRIDAGIVDHLCQFFAVNTVNPKRLKVAVQFHGPDANAASRYMVTNAQILWQPGRRVRFENFIPAAVNGNYYVTGWDTPGSGFDVIIEFAREGSLADVVVPTFGTNTATNTGRILFQTPFGFMEVSEGQSIGHYQGLETEGADPVLANVYGASNVHGYRGLARTVIGRHNLSNFGDRVPEHSAVAKINAQQSVRAPFRDLIREAFRGDPSRCDFRDLPAVPLHGFARRGPQPTSSALQPLAIAHGVETQEVGPKFRFFTASTAHLIQLGENDFGVFLGRTRRDARKFRHTREPDRLLPRKLSLMYRDPFVDYSRQEAIARSEAVDTKTTDHTVLDCDPVVLYRWDAERIVQQLFAQSLVARDGGEIDVGPSHCYILPGDRITFDALNSTEEEVDVGGGAISFDTRIRPIEAGSVTMEVDFATSGRCRLVDVGGGEFVGHPGTVTVFVNTIDYTTGNVQYLADEPIVSAVIKYEFRNAWRMRVQRVTKRANHVTTLSLVAVSEQFAKVGSPSQVNTPSYQPTLIAEPVEFEVLDVPAIGVRTMGAYTRGLIFAACPRRGGTWRGAIAYTSLDGIAWTPRGFIAEPTPIGVTTNALANITTTTTGTWDYSATLTVHMQYGAPTDATLEEIDALKNWALVGNEIIAFRTAVANVDGTYTLSGLLRGLRNTEEHIGSHVSGERFVLLAGCGDGEMTGGLVPANGLWDDWTLSGSGNGAALLNTPYQYKVVPIGGVVVSEIFPPKQLTITGRFRRPFSVEKLVQATGAQADSDSTVWTTHPTQFYSAAVWLAGDVVVQWRRRHRAIWDWNTPFPIWELYERYRITVKKNGVAVDVRYLGDPIVGSWLTETIFRYTLAEQTAAGFASGNTAEIVVEQEGMFEYSPPRSITWTIP